MEQDEITSGFGKFKSAQCLLDAYNALEAEFTKRCQRLKETERLLTESAAKPNELGTNDCNSKLVGSSEKNAAEQQITACADSQKTSEPLQPLPASIEQADFISNLESDDFIENVILKSDRIVNSVISDYLRRLSAVSESSGAFLGSSIGRVALSPIKRPKTLSEAKAVADRYLRGLE